MRRDTTDGSPSQLLVAELKTVILNLGQAIRQVNAAKDAFFASHKELVPDGSPVTVSYPLVVWASHSNIQRLAEFPHVLADTTVEVFHEDKATATSMAGCLEIQRAILRARAAQSPSPEPPEPRHRITLPSWSGQEVHHAPPPPPATPPPQPRTGQQADPSFGLVSWSFSELTSVRRRPPRPAPPTQPWSNGYLTPHRNTIAHPQAYAPIHGQTMPSLQAVTKILKHTITAAPEPDQSAHDHQTQPVQQLLVSHARSQHDTEITSVDHGAARATRAHCRSRSVTLDTRTTTVPRRQCPINTHRPVPPSPCSTTDYTKPCEPTCPFRNHSRLRDTERTLR